MRMEKCKYSRVMVKILRKAGRSSIHKIQYFGVLVCQSFRADPVADMKRV